MAYLFQEESILTLEWRDSSDMAINPPGPIKVSLFTPDMGHGSSPTQISPIVDENKNPILGAYRISDMYFTMSGKWDIDVTTTDYLLNDRLTLPRLPALSKARASMT